MDRRSHLAIVAVLSALLLFSNLHIGGLSGYDDAIFAHESKEMLRTGDWGTVRANGALHFDYLPMFYWMGAVSMKVFGVSDFAAKFPAALCGLLLIILTYFIAKELTSEPFVPITAAWVLLLTQYFVKYATHAMSDVPFALFFAAAIFFYLKSQKKREYLILAGLSIALAVMTRTILGVIPAAIIGTHLIVTGRLNLLRSKYFWAGCLVAFALPGSWYLYSYSIHGELFLREHFSFISGKINSSDGFDVLRFVGGLLKYPILLAQHYQPWLIPAIIGLWWHGRDAIKTRESSSVLLVVWVAMVIVPFSLVSAKILRYIMPVFPAFAILAAFPISLWMARLIKPRFRNVAYAILCIAIVLIALLPNPRYRAANVLEITPAVVSVSAPQERIVLYTSGELHHDIKNQLLWYSDRYFDHIADADQLRQELKAGTSRAFLVDKKTFDEKIRSSSAEIAIAGETGEFVCFRTK